ncbi:MAG: hypothetical protein JEZ14_14240 [Marinilabiliaceae bacterium]|nr:hypothetical protein [Marinilabiliaceae bacterium]
MKKLILLTVVLISTFHLSSGQFRSVLARPDSLARFEFRFLRASFEDVEKVGILSGIYDLAFSYPINKNWGLEVSIPLAFMKYEIENYEYYGYNGGYGGYNYYLEGDNTIEKNDNGIGNVMMGVRFQKWFTESRCFQWRGQLYLPTTTKEEFDLGQFMLLSDFNDFPKYAQDVTTAAFLFGYYNNPHRGGFYYVDGGPQFMVSHDSDVDSEVFVRYAFGGGYNSGTLAVSGELIGQAIVSEDMDEFNNRFCSSLNFGVHYTKSFIKPSLFYSVYLKDDINEVVSGVLGVKVAISIASL